MRNPRFTVAPIAIGLVAIAVPLIWGTVQVQQFNLASRLSVFVLYLGSPLTLVIPFLAAWAGNSRLYAELGQRHLTNLGSRQSPTKLLQMRLLKGFLIPAAIFAVSILAVYLVAFVLWPVLGDPFLDPSVYFLQSPQEVAKYDQAQTGFSQLMAFGSPVFGVIAALWFAFAAGVYGAFAAAALLVLNNRMLAILLPMGVYIIETIATALTVGPYAGLLYSLSPFLLRQAPIIVSVTPTFILAAVVALIWGFILKHPHDLRLLR